MWAKPREFVLPASNMSKRTNECGGSIHIGGRRRVIISPSALLLVLLAAPARARCSFPNLRRQGRSRSDMCQQEVTFAG